MDKVFYWNKFAWRHPLLKIIKPNQSYGEILELGASGNSSVSFFFNSFSKLTITCYPEKELDSLNQLVVSQTQCENVITMPMSIHEVSGRYDLIIMKSVLGGVCRLNSSDDCHMHLINQLVDRNLTENGQLITLDNGYSIFESLLSKFGARKNRWRFFHKEDFQNFSQQECFGFFTAFSFRTRIGIVGSFIEHILFALDFFLIPFHRNRYPTVIVTKYSKALG